MIKGWQLLFWTIIFYCAGVQASIESEVDESLRSGDYHFFENQNTNIRNPFEMRDPFRTEAARARKSEEISRKRRSDFTNLPTIAEVPVERIRITGILLGETRRAVAKTIERSSEDGGEEVLSEDSYILREGMTIGQYGAEIKAILPGGVVLVEEILNVYDQLEFIETILPLRPEG